jgi:hypothetical protein
MLWPPRWSGSSRSSGPKRPAGSSTWRSTEPRPTREQLGQALKGVVIVRITPTQPGAQRRPTSTRSNKETEYV